MLRIASTAWRSSSPRIIAQKKSAVISLRPSLGFGSGGSQFARVAPLQAFHSIRFNSTQTDGSEAEPLSSSVTDISTIVNDVTQIGDLHALGLGSHWTPVGLLQNSLEYLHIGVGLPWWGSIMAATVVARFCLVPLVVFSMKNGVRLANIKPEMEELTNKMNASFREGDTKTAAMYSTELQTLFTKHNCSPFRGLMTPLLQAPIFISFFFGIRKMAELPVVSMKTGGILWFTDLTIPDPTYVLPLLTAATFLTTIELGTDGVSPQQKGQMKTIFRIMAFAMIPVTASFPAGMLTYWFTANLFSLSQFVILNKIPFVKKAFGIPDTIKHPVKPQSQPVTQGFWETVKSQYNAGLKVAEEERLAREKLARLQRMQKERQGGQPPLPK